jgi:hypothetical protein
VIASDGNGGAFVAWQGAGIFVQRLDADGLPQWTAPGVQLSSSGSQPSIVADSPWGATVAWEESTGIYVQRVDYAGVPQWTAGGVQVATSGEVPLVLHYPGPGLGDPPGAFVAWGELVRVAAVDGSGTVTAPGVDGISLGGGVRLPGYMRMITDAAGGAYVIWADYAKNIVAQRINAGLPWGATPTVISSDAAFDEGPLDAAPDGSGGFLVSWSAIRLLPATGQVRVQRVDSSGTSLWAANGIVLVDSSVVGGSTDAWTFYGLRSSVDTDGAGGAIVAWNDWRNDPTGAGNDDIYAQRVDAFQSQRWTPNGVLLPPYIVGSTAPGSQDLPETVSDGNGGAIVTYQDLGGNSWDISATRLDAFGNKLFSNYVFTDFMGVDLDQREPKIVFDGSGPSPVGAIIAWDDQRSGLDIRAQKVEISGPANDDATNAFSITTGEFTETLFAATSDGASSCPGGGGVDVWFVFTPPEPGRLEVDTCGTNDLVGIDQGVDSVVSLHSAAPGTEGNQLACSDDWPTSGGLPTRCNGIDLGVGRDSATFFETPSIEPIWIRVGAFSDTPPGDFVLNVRFLPEPQAGAMIAWGALALAALRGGRRRRRDR